MGWGYGWRERSALTTPSHSSLLRTAFLLLLLVSATWLLGLLAVNSDTLSFHYLFAAFSCLQVGAGIHPLGPLCDLCPGAAAVRRRWGEASLVRRGWEKCPQREGGGGKPPQREGDGGGSVLSKKGMGGSLLSTCTCRGGSLCSLLVPALPPGPKSVRALP